MKLLRTLSGLLTIALAVAGPHLAGASEVGTGALKAGRKLQQSNGNYLTIPQLPGFAPAPAWPTPITDEDILQFALNLEYLEAEFYSWSAFGYGLSAADRGNGPPSTGGKKATLSATAQAYATEIANDEIAHVRFLRSALGSAAVPMPQVDIGPAFAAAANAALNTTLNPPFSPYVDDVRFFHGAFIFEDVGVTAYHGAAPLIQNKTYLDAAAGILAVEAYHGGIIRLLLASVPYTSNVPDYGVPVYTIVNAIANLRNTLASNQGPAGTTDAPLFSNGTLTLVPVDNNKIAYQRTPQQVLAIAYGGSASTPGGFFPQGLNGNIH